MISQQRHDPARVIPYQAGSPRIWPRLAAANDNRPCAAYIWRRVWFRIKQIAVAGPIIVLFGALLLSLFR